MQKWQGFDLMVEEAMLELSRQSGAPIRDDETVRAEDGDNRMINMEKIVEAVLDRAVKCGWTPPV